MLPRFVRFAFLLVPGLAVGLASAGAAGAVLLADSSAPVAAPAPSSTPAAADSTGTTNINAGAPQGSGGSASLSECPPPCTPTESAQQGSQPTGVSYDSGHSTRGSADSSPTAPSGAPHASGLGLLGSGSSGAVSPSGGSARGGACLSMLSDIPVPNLSGAGFSCDIASPAGSRTTSPGSITSTNGSAGPGGSVNSGQGAVDGSSADQTAACQGTRPVATVSRVPGTASTSIPSLALLAVALISLAAGFGLAVSRRGPPAT